MPRPTPEQTIMAEHVPLLRTESPHELGRGCRARGSRKSAEQPHRWGWRKSEEQPYAVRPGPGLGKFRKITPCSRPGAAASRRPEVRETRTLPGSVKNPRNNPITTA